MNIDRAVVNTKVKKVEMTAKAVRGVDLLVALENAKYRNGVGIWWIFVGHITLIS
ncbi:MAG: hypothetical protein ACE5J2_06310 [Nitrososphaerales archaeon]